MREKGEQETNWVALSGTHRVQQQDPRLSASASFALCLCTDGCARDETWKKRCAGWGFTATTRPTHNTGEMQALIEALFWLSSFVEQNILQASNNVLFTVDSLYVKGLIEDKFVARENRVLATLLRHMRGVTKKRSQLHIRWLRGRTGDMGNSIADSLADTGTLTELQYRWWRRWPPNGGWEEESLRTKSRKHSEGDNTLRRRTSPPTGQAQWTSPPDSTLPRTS